MDLNILDVKPHQVSRDMRGYSVFLYGEPKSGKTTIATRFPKHLLLAFEKGYNAIPGAMAIPINSWSDFRKVLKQLKDTAAKEKYETIIVDTADIAYELCSKYICSLNDVSAIGDIPYGKGYALVAQEFDSCLRSILQMDFGLVIISHDNDKTFKDESGNEFNKIVPTLDKRANNIVARMCDIIGYARVFTKEDGSSVTRLFMRGTPRFEAGSRFKYTPDYIEFGYSQLVNAIGEAIDKEAAEAGEELFTSERQNTYSEPEKNIDFDDLMAQFNKIINNLIEKETDEKMSTYWQPRITQITDKYLGVGNKVGNLTRNQVEALELIVDDLKELIGEG